jgi:hypothetical protein
MAFVDCAEFLCQLIPDNARGTAVCRRDLRDQGLTGNATPCAVHDER